MRETVASHTPRGRGSVWMIGLGRQRADAPQRPTMMPVKRESSILPSHCAGPSP